MSMVEEWEDFLESPSVKLLFQNFVSQLKQSPDEFDVRFNKTKQPITALLVDVIQLDASTTFRELVMDFFGVVPPPTTDYFDVYGEPRRDYGYRTIEAMTQLHKRFPNALTIAELHRNAEGECESAPLQTSEKRLQKQLGYLTSIASGFPFSVPRRDIKPQQYSEARLTRSVDPEFVGKMVQDVQADLQPRSIVVRDDTALVIKPQDDGLVIRTVSRIFNTRDDKKLFNLQHQAIAVQGTRRPANCTFISPLVFTEVLSNVLASHPQLQATVFLAITFQLEISDIIECIDAQGHFRIGLNPKPSTTRDGRSLLIAAPRLWAEVQVEIHALSNDIKQLELALKEITPDLSRLKKTFIRWCLENLFLSDAEVAVLTGHTTVGTATQLTYRVWQNDHVQKRLQLALPALLAGLNLSHTGWGQLPDVAQNLRRILGSPLAAAEKELAMARNELRAAGLCSRASKNPLHQLNYLILRLWFLTAQIFGLRPPNKVFDLTLIRRPNGDVLLVVNDKNTHTVSQTRLLRLSDRNILSTLDAIRACEKALKLGTVSASQGSCWSFPRPRVQTVSGSKIVEWSEVAERLEDLLGIQAPALYGLLKTRGLRHRSAQTDAPGLVSLKGCYYLGHEPQWHAPLNSPLSAISFMEMWS